MPGCLLLPFLRSGSVKSRPPDYECFNQPPTALND
jgi:hypothetical protein